MRDGIATFALTALVLIASSCASVPSATPPPPAAVQTAREANDAALVAAAARMGFLEGHFVAVAGGALLGGTLLAEDTAALVSALRPIPEHAYFFRVGEEGDLDLKAPAHFADAMAGNALLAALGAVLQWDPETATTTLSLGDRSVTYTADDGSCRIRLLVAPASRTAPPVFLTPVFASGFTGTLVLSPVDADALDTHTSEIPGEASLTAVLTGRRAPCRRVLLRVEIPDLGAATYIEALAPAH
jgi:hypothetical protein